jgi:hypothetical protein
LAGVFTACQKPNDPEEPPVITYPVDIPFTDYFLDETSCQWVNLPYDEKAILINSNEELDNYLSCLEGFEPVIDFSENSLILVSGKTDTGIDHIYKKITQLSETQFKLDINIELDATDAKAWCIALLTTKITEKDTLESIVTYKESIYPIDIPCYKSKKIKCGFPYYGKEILLAINSIEDIKENFGNCVDSTYLNIDFTKNTLLVLSGNCYNQYDHLIVELQQLSSKKYRVNVYVLVGAATTPSEWYMEVTTQKIGKDCEIEYNIIYE